jgi:hypothetical protein
VQNGQQHGTCPSGFSAVQGDDNRCGPRNSWSLPIQNRSSGKSAVSLGSVVWSNLESKIYHFAGHKDYGHTQNGAYMCEADATKEGMRAAENEKRP